MTDYLVLDIETAVTRKLDGETLRYIKKNKTLKDPEKIKKHAESKAAFTTGLPQIISIAYSIVCGHTNEYVEEPQGKAGGNEEELLLWFADEAKEYGHAKLTGYNIKGFDYPNLTARCALHSIALPWRIGKWDFIDLMDFPYYGQGGLKSVCYWRGITQNVACSEHLGLKTVDGSNVANMYKEERWAELLAYNIEDVRMTSELLLKTLPYYKL